MTKTNGVLSFLGLFALATSANSAILYQSDGRYISHTLGGTFTPTSPYADFNDDWWAWEAGAFQNTVLTGDSMSGSGSTYAGYDAMHYGAEATSVFSVTFGVDQLTEFVLEGSLDTGWYYGSELNLSLLENGTEIFSYDIWQDEIYEGVNPFVFTGQFSVGNTYQLELMSYSYDSDYYYEQWQFDLSTVPAVPAPAAVWLFASGLVALMGLTKRKGR